MIRALSARKTITALVSVAVLVVPGVHAQDKPPLKCYEAEFVLEPQEFSREPIWIAEKDPLFDARLLPRELFEVKETVTLEGKSLLRPGDQLMTMRSNSAVKCNFPQLREKAIAARQRICVFDPDADGVFDQVYVRSRGGDIWFAMAWEHPKKPTTVVEPVVMEKIDPALFKGGPSIFFYSDHTPLRRKPRDGSPPYYEAFTRAKLQGNDGLKWYMELRPNGGYDGYVKGSFLVYDDMIMIVHDVAAERMQVSYQGNFGERLVDLPFLNSYERKCDTYRSNAF